MTTGLQHTHCIVTTCQSVNLLWEWCYNHVLVQDWQLNISARLPDFSGISEIFVIIWYIDLSTFCNLTFLILCWKLACPNLLVWMTRNFHPLLYFSGYHFGQVFTSILFGSVDTDTRKWLVCIISNTSEWHQSTLP